MRGVSTSRGRETTCTRHWHWQFAWKQATPPSRRSRAPASPELPEAQREMDLQGPRRLAPVAEKLLDGLEPLAQRIHVDAQLRCRAPRIVTVVEIGQHRV